MASGSNYTLYSYSTPLIPYYLMSPPTEYSVGWMDEGFNHHHQLVLGGAATELWGIFPPAAILHRNTKPRTSILPPIQPPYIYTPRSVSPLPTPLPVSPHCATPALWQRYDHIPFPVVLYRGAFQILPNPHMHCRSMPEMLDHRASCVQPS